MIYPPKQLSLSHYRELIKNLPYEEQAFETKLSTWQRECALYPGFQAFCNQAFGKEESVKLSRSDLFRLAGGSFEEALFAVILWGYPRNMRGGAFQSILENLAVIKDAFPNNKNLSAVQYADLHSGFAGRGIGLSTLTKLLYFFGYTLEGHRCLILDSRIIEVMNEQIFIGLSALSNFTEFNKKAKYIQYLGEMEKMAKAEGYKVDQLELFLFQFGKNLKYSRALGKVTRG